jgi:hypothetical protein
MVLINTRIQKAKEYIKNKPFYKIKPNKYHFRFKPKYKFENKSFKTKIINEVSLLYGKLKKEHELLYCTTLWIGHFV